MYLVGTPIGNLGDLTLRAVDTLRRVEIVAAEDTRRARALLSHLDIHQKQLMCVNAHATEQQIARLLDAVLEGRSAALITDAGMPSVSDPGSRVVRAASERAVTMELVPGPSAVTAAIALSGLVDSAFLFLGFLPRQGKERRSAIERISATGEPVVVFESPVRAARTLGDLAEVMPDRSAFVGRELTKRYEEALRGTLAELAARPEPWRGELVLVLGPTEPNRVATAESPADVDQVIGARLAEGASTKMIASELSRSHGLPRREAYRRVQALRERT